MIYRYKKFNNYYKILIHIINNIIIFDTILFIDFVIYKGL